MKKIETLFGNVKAIFNEKEMKRLVVLNYCLSVESYIQSRIHKNNIDKHCK